MSQELWTRIAVIGAGGKMGRGISLILLLEMIRAECERQQNISLGKCRLCLIDTNYDSLYVMVRQLRPSIKEYAERNIQKLRSYCVKNEKLVSNEEIIQAFCDVCLRSIEISSDFAYAKGVKMVFEAVFEDAEVKIQTLQKLKNYCDPEAYYFTNTSSIPVTYIAEKTGLNNQIVGLHFYNPPVAQKLIETIFPVSAPVNLRQVTEEICQRLNKVAIQSADISGFIGNGHMIREMVYANAMVLELEKNYLRTDAIYYLNEVTQNFLVRPMGIFQLMDFVGLDVCLHIAKVMGGFLNEEFPLPICEQLVEKGITGGIDYDSSQKNGIFAYQKHTVIGIYDWLNGEYKPLNKETIEKYNQFLGTLPKGFIPWKKMQKDLNRGERLSKYLATLADEKTEGAKLAKKFIDHSAKITEKLVKDGVAKRIEDVDEILEKGFHHLYAPRFAANNKVGV